VADLLGRAQQLVAAGLYDARPAEIAAVHAAIYPDRDAVCQTCRGELGKAYYAIKRWAEQPNSSSIISTSSTVKKNTSTARFKSDHTIYTPHGLGIAYSNDNLTDKAARYIIANDPDAAGLFSELPPEASEEEEQPAQAVAPTPAPAQAPVAAGQIDYVKLAQAIVDIQNKAKAQEPDTEVKELTEEAKGDGQHLTASTGGAADAGNQPNGSDNSGTDADGDDKPVRLSRMNKEQLVATYTAELGQAPDEKLTNDELRDAIAEKRSSMQDPE
jgi:hypothetical protein